MNGNLDLPTDLSMHKNELPCSFENDSEDKLEDVVGIFHSFFATDFRMSNLLTDTVE